MKKIKAAIIGPGNIGTDLMLKLTKSNYVELDTVVGIDPNSEGLALAKNKGFNTSHNGIETIIGNKDIKIVFDATSAGAHKRHAQLLHDDGKIAIDLTPAAIGPKVVPAVNIGTHISCSNINMITCGGQATIPIVYAIHKAVGVKYAEIVATIASKSAGTGTRQNIDEFTHTTAGALSEVGGAGRGKAIVILNPSEPPIMMRDTIYAQVAINNAKVVQRAIDEMVKKVQKYVPGYRLKMPPLIEGDRVTVILEVEGAGDYLPRYAGNLDIMTAAAKQVGDCVAQRLLHIV